MVNATKLMQVDNLFVIIEKYVTVKRIPLTHTSLKSIVPSPEKMDYAENDEFLQDIESPDRDIPTFDGAEFCGDKPLSDDTLLRMMENLAVSPER